jgi:demethylmenaquinone methyltransferase/2-methoxy-6-polyprenyl-1,4-benzoquinol methylase
VSSYVFMKVLESRARRYDRGIALLSLGQSEKARRRLVADNVRQGARVLEIGCGTGTAAILAARGGADVLGFDVSADMLAVAREKVKAARLEGRIRLVEMGVSGMDRLADRSFDLVMATLVFSELSPEEQAYALRHARRTLRDGGRLAIADEARPEGLVKRVLHRVVRFPLTVATFVLTQTTTSAVEGLCDLVRAAGFRVEVEERSALDSFLYLVAVRD